MIWLWVLTVFLFLLGLAGIFIPGLPGIGLIFLGILIYGLATGFADISGMTVISAGIVAALAWVADYAGSVAGARLGGGRTLAMTGAIIGAIGGTVLGGPGGLLVGAFLGSLTGALLEGQRERGAMRVALWSTLGIIGATVLQLVLALAMIGTFIGALVW
ncbi:MAG: DUF456 domain-containing protein [Acidobacteriota bacterium]